MKYWSGMETARLQGFLGITTGKAMDLGNKRKGMQTASRLQKPKIHEKKNNNKKARGH